MARIKLKIGENELEVDSRDFYVDNQTLGEIIDNISQYLPENQAKIVYESTPTKLNSTIHGLENLDDAETFEPEFSEPKYITSTEIKSKLKILAITKYDLLGISIEIPFDYYPTDEQTRKFIQQN